MSALDENPFVEPNPFKNREVRHVASNTLISIEEFNPFDPLYANIVEQMPPQPQAQSVFNMAELEQRQEEELEQTDEEMHDPRRHNWPPLPEKCCFQPCFYQDIDVDIPLPFQKTVRRLFHLWVFHGFVMLLNIMGGVITADYTVISMGLLYMIVSTPFSYMCWFRPAYKGFRSNSSLNFMLFFVMFFFQIVMTIMQTIGVPGSGTIGFVRAIIKFTQSRSIMESVVAIIELSIAFCFGCAVTADLYFVSKINSVFRHNGASFAKAQAEFRAELFGNRDVPVRNSTSGQSHLNNRF